MGLSDFDSNFDADTSAYNRQNRTNPSEFAPGQSSDDGDWTNMFADNNSQSVGSSMDTFGSSPMMGGGGQLGSSFGMGGMSGSGFGMLGGMQQQPQQQQSAEDVAWDLAKKAGSGTVSFTKELVNSFKSCNALFWQKYGADTIYVSGACAGLGLVLRLFGITVGMQLLIGGVVAAIPSVLLLMFNTEKAQMYDSPYNDGGMVQEQAPLPPTEPAFAGGDFDDAGFDSGFDDGFGDDDFGGDFDDDDGFGDFDDDDFDFNDTPVEQPEDGMDTEEAINSMPEITVGMYTRDFLFDTFTKTLPKITPSFAQMKEYSEDSNEFLYWGDKLCEAAEVTGCSEEDLPELQTLKENLFTVVLTCNRPKGFKPDKVAEEMASIYATTENGGVQISSKVSVAGLTCEITIFTGKTALISLRDMYANVNDFMHDTENYMPVALGVDTKGKVLAYDFKKLESIIITGMPRSGKSWFVQCVMYQMCSFVSPKELNFYICDPKEGISDFKAFTLPHVRKFVSGDNNIVETLRKVVKVEGPRRKKIIGDAGFVNIWDFKESQPDFPLPIIYILIDEVVTLAERMEKEVKQEFQGLLVELISQLPALGIRAFLIPHVIKNDIIAKTATDLVPCKISVCGDAEHIERATGSKPKDFPYKLKNKGDMAVRMPAVSTETMFIHAPALTKSNPENNKLFDYARRMWSKIEPDCVQGSVSEKAEVDSENKELLANMEVDDDDLDMFS